MTMLLLLLVLMMALLLLDLDRHCALHARVYNQSEESCDFFFFSEDKRSRRKPVLQPGWLSNGDRTRGLSLASQGLSSLGCAAVYSGRCHKQRSTTADR